MSAYVSNGVAADMSNPGADRSGAIPAPILGIAEQLKNGMKPAPATTRALLKWYGAPKRADRIMHRIRSDLVSLQLRTEPDFESAYIDAPLEFVAEGPGEGGATTVEVSAVLIATRAESAGGTAPPLPIDPTYRLSRLKAANNQPVCVDPASSVQEAVTKMLTHDFSQLPIMTSEREVKGVISWRSIGKRLALCVACQLARDCMDPATIVDEEISIFDAIEMIVVRDFVLVRRKDGVISGIVTTSDLGTEFGRLGEPYLLLREIENHLRRLIGSRFPVSEFAECKNPRDKSRTIEGPEDLTLGEIQRFLDGDNRWGRLGLALERREFVRWLDEVRKIRNDAMHFDPDGVLPEELEKLRSFVRFMRELRQLGLN